MIGDWSRSRRDPRIAWIAFIALAALLIALPFLADWAFGRAWVRIIAFALLYIMLALGLNIVVGYAGLLDLGYVAFFAVGAYFYALLASPQFGLHLPFWLLLRWARASRASSACCSARRRCACAGTISPSSRWASARSSASFS